MSTLGGSLVEVFSIVLGQQRVKYKDYFSQPMTSKSHPSLYTLLVSINVFYFAVILIFHLILFTTFLSLMIGTYGMLRYKKQLHSEAIARIYIRNQNIIFQIYFSPDLLFYHWLFHKLKSLFLCRFDLRTKSDVTEKHLPYTKVSKNYKSIWDELKSITIQYSQGAKSKGQGKTINLPKQQHERVQGDGQERGLPVLYHSLPYHGFYATRHQNDYILTRAASKPIRIFMEGGKYSSKGSDSVGVSQQLRYLQSKQILQK